MERSGTDSREIDRESAIQSHNTHRAFIEKINEATIASGHAAIRNLFLMHGGALVAMLTFISTTINTDANVSLLKELLSPMVNFSIGLALATAASAGAYLTNYCYTSGAVMKRLTWKHPYVEDTAVGRRWRTVGVCLHLMTVILAFVSLFLFVRGFFEVKAAFEIGIS
jgi:hypothetical protein